MRAFLLSAFLGLMVAGPAGAKTVSGETAARVTQILAACVTAVTERSNAPFQDWQAEDGFVPIAYMFYERWVSPGGGYKVAFGQRSDKPGRPYVCDVERLRASVTDLTAAREDQHLIGWVNELPATTLSGVRFTRHEGFQRAENAQVLSACLNGQRLILNANATPKGTARFGVVIPVREVLAC